MKKKLRWLASLPTKAVGMIRLVWPPKTGGASAKKPGTRKFKILCWGTFAVIVALAYLATCIADAPWYVTIGATLGSTLVYGALRAHIIKEPGIGFAHWFGKVIAVVGPGLYLPPPGMHVDEQSLKEIAVEFSDPKLASSEDDPMTLGGTVWIQIKTPVTDDILQGLLCLPVADAVKKAEKEAQSVLQEEVAKRTVPQVRAGVGEIENAIVAAVETALNDAWMACRSQVTNVDDTTRQDAERIKKLGAARAQAARAYRDAVGDETMRWSAVGDAIRGAAEGIFGKKGGE